MAKTIRHPTAPLFVFKRAAHSATITAPKQNIPKYSNIVEKIYNYRTTTLRPFWMMMPRED